MAKKSVVSSEHAKVQESDPNYTKFEKMIRDKIASLGNTPVFTTSVAPEKLWNAYLTGFSRTKRQHYNCHCCRQFIETYGGLVTLVNGHADPVLWHGDTAAEEFAKTDFENCINNLDNLLVSSTVTGVFLSDKNVWGTPQTGKWTHLSGENPNVFKGVLLNAGQVMAQKKQDYTMLHSALRDYSLQVVSQAVAILEADALYRGEKTLGVAKWFLDLHKRIQGMGTRATQTRYDNLVWSAVATAPPGFPNINSTMISTLLSDLSRHLPFDHVRERWAAKMHPNQYRRPTAVTSGVLEQANKVVEKLNATGAFARRMANLSDIARWVWKPIPAKIESSGTRMFDHLKPGKKPKSLLTLPPQTMTWLRFKQKVLPTAEKIEFAVPHGLSSFYGLQTAEDINSPPLLRWDLESQRNPVSWYFYGDKTRSGSVAHQWNLSAGTYADVTVIFDAPPHWYDPELFKFHAPIAFFALKGCVETRNPGVVLFPETLRSEYKSIEKAVAAYSDKSKLADPKAGNANGIAIEASSQRHYVFRVTSSLGVAEYTIDRYE